MRPPRLRQKLLSREIDQVPQEHSARNRQANRSQEAELDLFLRFLPEDLQAAKLIEATPVDSHGGRKATQEEQVRQMRGEFQTTRALEAPHQLRSLKVQTLQV